MSRRGLLSASILAAAMAMLAASLLWQVNGRAWTGTDRKLSVNECLDLPTQRGVTARICSVNDGWTGRKWIFLITGPAAVGAVGEKDWEGRPGAAVH